MLDALDAIPKDQRSEPYWALAKGGINFKTKIENVSPKFAEKLLGDLVGQKGGGFLSSFTNLFKRGAEAVKKGAEEVGKYVKKEAENVVQTAKDVYRVGKKGLENFAKDPAKFIKEGVKLTEEQAKEFVKDPAGFAKKHKLVSTGLKLVGTVTGQPELRYAGAAADIAGFGEQEGGSAPAPPMSLKDRMFAQNDADVDQYMKWTSPLLRY